MNLVFNDISIGDIYEHEQGGFYQVTELIKQSRLIIGNKLNAAHPRDSFHSVSEIKNFFGKFS